MRIAIVENDAEEARELGELCRRIGVTSGTPIALARFESAERLVATVDAGALSLAEIDLALLDCYLDGRLTGMDLARDLRRRGFAGTIAFTTGSRDFAIEGYEVGAVAYLLKPIEAQALSRVIAQAAHHAADAPRETLPVKLNGPADRAVSLDAAKLASARSQGHYVELTYLDGSSERLRTSFRSLVDALAGYQRFCSPARGQLVNLDAVESLEELDFKLINGRVVPISRSTLPLARERYASWKFEQLRRR